VQHPATPGNTRQHIAPYCNTLQHIPLGRVGHGRWSLATRCNTLHRTATCCNTYLLGEQDMDANPVQHTATHCTTLQHSATHTSKEDRTRALILFNALQHTSTNCNTLLQTATHTSWEDRTSVLILCLLVSPACVCAYVVAGCCSVLQCVAQDYRSCPIYLLQRVTLCCNACSFLNPVY